MSFNPGGGGIASASDVALSNPQSSDMLGYNGTLSKWQNQPAVTSVAGRTGSVVIAESDVTNLTTDLAAKAATTDSRFSATAVTTQAGTTYTLALSDAGGFVVMNNASATTLTVPPNSSVAFPTGSVVSGMRKGAGQVTIAAGAGVTLRTSSSLTTRAQYSVFSLTKIATDEWVVSGDMT